MGASSLVGLDAAVNPVLLHRETFGPTWALVWLVHHILESLISTSLLRCQTCCPIPAARGKPNGHDPRRWLPTTQVSSPGMECYSHIAAVLVSRFFPNKGLELWAYQASIVWATRNFEGSAWVASPIGTEEFKPVPIELPPVEQSFHWEGPRKFCSVTTV